MAEVTIYTTPYCPFCIRAKALLAHKGVMFTEIDVGGNSEMRRVMQERAGGRYTVPQIFIDALHVGGCDDLFALESANRLDGLLRHPRV